MKAVEYYTGAELGNIPYCIRYFFNGDGGLWKRNNSYMYASSGDSIESDLQKNQILESAGESEFKLLSKYIGKEREQRLNEIEKLEAQILSNKRELSNLVLVGNVIKPNLNMKDNLKLIFSEFNLKEQP